MVTQNELGKILTALRGGRSRTEIAKRAGLHPRTLAKLERGERRLPRYETLKALAMALGVELSALEGQQ